MMKYAPEDTRRHGIEAEDQQLPGGANRPHPSATQPPQRDSSTPF
jgi:hypothetical protein